MSDFMQPEITVKQLGWQVETRDAGTCFVPGDVAPIPEWLKPGVQIDQDTGPFQLLLDHVSDYCEGTRIESIEVCQGYFARLSAPGYLDCTEWCCYSTIREARDALKE